jgi:hypothetical protein
MSGIPVSQAAERARMKVIYHADARRPYDPNEPAWSGPPPCSGFPTSGAGTLQINAASTPPKLKRKTPGDYSRLTARTRAFTSFLAEYTISAQGRVVEVRVLRAVSEEFDRIVLGELETSVYEPATLNGAPVSVCATLLARPHP